MSVPSAVPSPPSRLPWIAFLLALAVPLIVLISMTTPVSLGPLHVPFAIAAVVLAIVALVRRRRPLWPAIGALVVVGVCVLVFVVFAIWTIAGFVQVMTV